MVWIIEETVMLWEIVAMSENWRNLLHMELHISRKTIISISIYIYTVSN